MKSSRLKWIVPAAAALVAFSASAALAELELPRVSPKASVTQTLGYTDVTIGYSRPGVKGRAIWGALVPFDAAWRTGANEATLFTTSGELKVNGQTLPAGTYSFFTIPGKESWTVVFNKEKDLWGAYEYKPEQDALKVQAKPRAAEHAEWLSYGFENLTPNGGDLVIRWEKIALPITLETDAADKAMANVRTELAAAKSDDWRTAYRGADYAFKNGLNADEAVKWAEGSVKVQENFYNVSLLAQMRAKAGNTKEAITLAHKAIKLGKESKDKVDTAPTEALLAAWSK
jgi:hypothetical protein